jgi:anti-sigma factor RsiW
LYAVNWEAASVRRGRIAGLVVAATLGIAAVAIGLGVPLSRQVSPFVRSAVTEHDRFMNDPAALPVVGTDAVAVAEKLEHRLPFRLGLPPESADGIRLSGGAVLTVGGTRAALLVYRVRGTPVTLVLTTPREVAGPVQEIVTYQNIVFRSARWGGRHTLEWSDRRFTYVLVSNDRDTTRRACVICHGSPQGRAMIRGFFPGI